MRKGERRRTIFKKRKRIGVPITSGSVQNINVSGISEVNQPSTSTGIGLVAPQPKESELQETPVSASKNKIGDIDGKYQRYVKQKNTDSNRNIIVNFDILSKVLGSAVKCVECNSVGLNIENPKNNGLCSEITLHCTYCGYNNSFLSLPQLSIGKDLHEVNVRLVYGLRSIGRGLKAAQIFSGIMNLPPPPTKFKRYTDLLGSTTEDVCFESMDNAIEEAVTENNDSRDLAIAIDGTWQKRGHTLMNGAISATSFDTGKVVDVAILSKFCKCVNKKNHSPNCTSNYIGSSGRMEVKGAEQIFQRSLQKNVRYTRYLGDGDSKGFSHVESLGIYGDTSIEKLECIGHIQKRMGSRLRRLKQKSKSTKLSDGKPLGGANRLTDAVIDNIQNYYGLAIRRNVESVQKMQEAVWAIYWHMQSTDESPHHGLCPKGKESWCKYQKAVANQQHFSHKKALPAVVMKEIKPIFNDLAKADLLKKCVHGKTQNPNESLNNVIWNRIPKTVFVANKTLHFGIYDAISCFNDGYIAKCETMNKCNMQIGLNTIEAMKRLDKDRVYFAQKQVLEITKKARQMRRHKKMKIEDVEEDPDDPSYGYGMH